MLVGSVIFLLLFAGYFFGWMFPVYFSVVCFALYLPLKKRYPKFLGPDWTIAIVMTITSTAFSIYTTMYIPIKDFTAYAVGNNLKEKMNDGIPSVYETKLIYTNKQTGKDKTFTLNDPEWQDTVKWKWKETINEEVKKGKLASISSFNPEGDYEQLTPEEKNHPALKSIIDKGIAEYYQRYVALKSLQYGHTDTIDPMDYDKSVYTDSLYQFLGQGEKILNPNKPFKVDHKQYLVETEKVILFTMLHTETANTGAMKKIKLLIAAAKKAGTPVFILTASGVKEQKELEKKFNLGARYLIMDETELKIVVRSNPGLIVLKKGVVAAKWAGRALPEWDDLKEKL
jgi:hypothetical protein